MFLGLKIASRFLKVVKVVEIYTVNFGMSTDCYTYGSRTSFALELRSKPVEMYTVNFETPADRCTYGRSVINHTSYAVAKARSLYGKTYFFSSAGFKRNAYESRRYMSSGFNRSQNLLITNGGLITERCCSFSIRNVGNFYNVAIYEQRRYAVKRGVGKGGAVPPTGAGAGTPRVTPPIVTRAPDMASRPRVTPSSSHLRGSGARYPIGGRRTLPPAFDRKNPSIDLDKPIVYEGYSK